MPSRWSMIKGIESKRLVWNTHHRVFETCWWAQDKKTCSRVRVIGQRADHCPARLLFSPLRSLSPLSLVFFLSLSLILFRVHHFNCVRLTSSELSLSRLASPTLTHLSTHTYTHLITVKANSNVSKELWEFARAQLLQQRSRWVNDDVILFLLRWLHQAQCEAIFADLCCNVRRWQKEKRERRKNIRKNNDV